MNATHHIDHLQAVTHVTSLVNSQVVAGDTAINKPKTAVTSHYDPSGTEVAIVSNTSYEGVTFAADGTISGGNLAHESFTPEGTKLNSALVSFQGNGNPASAQINVSNISGEGDFKNIQMDMSGVTWNNTFGISSGQVKISTTDGLTQQKKNDGVIQFENENVTSGSITHYDPDNNGAVSGYSEVDYSQVKFLGSSILGGQYSVKSMTVDKVLVASSSVSISPEGRIQAIETTNTDPGSSAITTKVAMDFSKIVFNARNEFVSGEIGLNVNDNTGNLLSQTAVAFNNSLPALTTTSVYNKAQLQNKIVVDYSNSQFNNDHKVVNSTKKVDVYSGSGELLSSTIIAYDQFGKKTQGGLQGTETTQISTTQSKTTKTKATSATTKTQPAKSNTKKNDPGAKSAKKAGDTDTTQKTDKTYRADNTLEQVRVITLQGDTPISALITSYATDGITTIKTFTMDLTGLTFDPASNAVSGALNLQTHLGGNILNSESTIQY